MEDNKLNSFSYLLLIAIDIIYVFSFLWIIIRIYTRTYDGGQSFGEMILLGFISVFVWVVYFIQYFVNYVISKNSSKKNVSEGLDRLSFGILSILTIIYIGIWIFN